MTEYELSIVKKLLKPYTSVLRAGRVYIEIEPERLYVLLKVASNVAEKREKECLS